MFKIIRFFIILLLIPVVPILTYKWINPPVTAIQWNQRELRKEKGPWLDLKEIPDVFEKAVIAAEDQRLFEHSGFDFKAIEKAIEHNKKGKTKRGPAPSANKPQKTSFFGKAGVGCVKDWKPI